MDEVVVAVSGGMDSLYTLLQLRERYSFIRAVHGVFYQTPETSRIIDSLQEICTRLEISFECHDLRREFAEEVINSSHKSYHEGKTPNPCALCNRSIKFGLFRKVAAGKKLFATGHYCRLVPSPYEYGSRFLLAPPADLKKNQCYFLSLVEGKIFENVLFPLENIQKRDVRTALKDYGLPVPSQRESVDICFKTERKPDHACYKDRPEPGSVFLSAKGKLKKIGFHCGVENYTVGQRHGLNIPWKYPLFVIKKDARANALIVGGRNEASCGKLSVCMITWHVPFELWPSAVFVRTRYTASLIKTECKKNGECLDCQFENEIFPPAPGQIAVFYDKNEYILGGGEILGEK